MLRDRSTAAFSTSRNIGGLYRTAQLDNGTNGIRLLAAKDDFINLKTLIMELRG
jgi:hypothetical protein